MSVAAHSICPNYNRCNKYLEFTLKLDAYEERDRRKNAVIAAQAKRIAELEAMLNGGDSGGGRHRHPLPEETGCWSRLSG